MRRRPLALALGGGALSLLAATPAHAVDLDPALTQTRGIVATVVDGGQAATQQATSGQAEQVVQTAVGTVGSIAFPAPFTALGLLGPTLDNPRAQAQVVTGEARTPDTTAPTATVTNRSRLRSAARLRRIVLRIAMDEPGRVVLGGRLSVAGRELRLPATVLEFGEAGAARLELRLSARARTAARRARSGRLVLGVTTADRAGNARRGRVVLRLAR